MKRVLLFLTITMLPLLSLHAQDAIMQVYGLYGNQSIIREVSSQKRLVYSNPNKLVFAQVEDSTSSVDLLELPEDFMSVSDFTISNNYVYFCGMLKSGVPAMGRFLLTPFPPYSLTYCAITGVDTITAIKVFESFEYPPKEPPKHVLMIGSKDGKGILIDAMLAPGGWDTYYITLLTKEGYTVRHDDIDILDDYVVVASHRLYGFIIDDLNPPTGQGFVWYIKKPSPAYAPLLTSNIYFTIPQIDPLKKIHLTACTGNACVAAALAYKFNGFIYSHEIDLYGYNYPYNIKTSRITEADLNKSAIYDICYENNHTSTEVLVQYDDGETVNSVIYTFQQIHANPGYNLTKHIYRDHKINSLVTKNLYGNHFVGSGTDINDLSGLNLYYYNNIPAGWECSVLDYVTSASLELQGKNGGSILYEHIFHSNITDKISHKITGQTKVCP